MQQVPPADGETEVGDTDQRLHARLMNIGIVLPENAEVLAGNMEAIFDCDMDGAKFNLALKSIRKGLNDSPTKDGAGIVGGNDQNDREGQRQGQGDPEQPAPASVLTLLRGDLVYEWHTA